jgi:hypothetical protein
MEWPQVNLLRSILSQPVMELRLTIQIKIEVRDYALNASDKILMVDSVMAVLQRSQS